MKSAASPSLPAVPRRVVYVTAARPRPVQGAGLLRGAAGFGWLGAAFAALGFVAPQGAGLAAVATLGCAGLMAVFSLGAICCGRVLRGLVFLIGGPVILGALALLGWR